VDGQLDLCQFVDQFFSMVHLDDLLAIQCQRLSWSQLLAILKIIIQSWEDGNISLDMLELWLVLLFHLLKMIPLEELPLPSHIASRLTFASLLCTSVDVGLVQFQHILFKLCDIFGVVNIPLKLEGACSKYINIIKNFNPFQLLVMFYNRR
jgi:hypothetical protein